ncbi:MAG: DUF5689 domain-containing protein, partial [Tuberibacillus sp.]
MAGKIRRKVTGWIFSLVLVASFIAYVPTASAESDAADAAATTDTCPITAVCGPAPHISPKVTNEHNNEKILFDNTHGQTAGAADWVINGGFSDFGNGLAEAGYDVSELRQTTPITYDDLKDYSVFVVPESNVPYKQSEQEAMIQYVQNGGSIFFIADHYNADRNKNRWDASEVFNGYRRGAFDNPSKGMSAEESGSEAMQGVSSSDWLANHFGVRFRYNALGDVNATNIVSPSDAFGITEGIHTVAMHSGSTLAILDPSHAKGLVYLPENPPKWGPSVDRGVYDNGGVAEGPMVAISKLGKGKAAFIGDSSPIEDSTPFYLREDTGEKKVTYDGYKEVDDDVLLVNLMNWLSKQEDYTSFDQTGISLDEPTALHDFEIPANSTEPQPEPWSAPEPGYKWWDPTTFKPGSYGSGKLAVDPTYGFVHQSTLPGEDQVFKIRVIGDKLEPFSTISDLKAGIYLSGGTQVAKFSLDGDHWQSNYGYSDPFTMNADSTGHAEIELYVRIKPGVSGSANLRLKEGSSNVTTESVTIANVDVEPLPPGSDNQAPDASSIDNVRALPDGTHVTVKGTITSEPGLYGAQGFYLQDASGGIYIYQSQTGLHAGDQVTVTGDLDTYRSEREITKPTIIKTGHGHVPEPAVVTGLSDQLQGQIVKLKDVTIKNIHDTTGAFEFDAVNSHGKLSVRVDSRTGVTPENFPFGNDDTIDLIGIAAIWDGTYQLKPRMLADFYGGILPINVVRALGADQKVTVEGVATSRSGIWGSKGFYIQDTTGGVYVYQSDMDVSEGDKLKITGTTSIYNGELEVNAEEVEKIGTEDLPKTLEVTPGGVNESNQGELVRLKKVTVTNIHQADKYGTTEMTAEKDGQSVVIRLDNRTGTTYADFQYKNGDVLNIVGISSEFNGTYQVKPRSIDDFEAADLQAPVTA